MAFSNDNPRKSTVTTPVTLGLATILRLLAFANNANASTKRIFWARKLKRCLARVGFPALLGNEEKSLRGLYVG